jgi:S1-C subfamily serine protease
MALLLLLPPMIQLCWVVNLLIREGKVTRGYIGIAGQTVPLPVKVVRYFNLPNESAVQIMGVAANSPASQTGLLQGDTIISLNQQPIAGVDAIHRLLTRDIIGSGLSIVILRNWTSRIERTITPIANPE